MITLLHGDNQLASRARFNSLKEEFKKQGYEIVNLDGKKVGMEEIALRAQTFSLLGWGTAVFVENFWSQKQNWAYKSFPFESGGVDYNIVFWEQRGLIKGNLVKVPGEWEVELFSFPRVAFKFLESVVPGRPKIIIDLLHQVLEKDSPEMLISLLSWHVRQLIWAREEPDKLVGPSWKTQKLLSQARNFTSEQLYNLHKSLAALDREIKTGNALLPLSSSLDLVMASI